MTQKNSIVEEGKRREVCDSDFTSFYMRYNYFVSKHLFGIIVLFYYKFEKVVCLS